MHMKNKGSFLHTGEKWFLAFEDSYVNFQENPWIWGIG